MDREQANNQRFFLKDSLIILKCAQLSHPPTHWQIFLPALPSDCFAIDFPGRAIIPSEVSLRPYVARAKRLEGTSATFHRVHLETPVRPL